MGDSARGDDFARVTLDVSTETGSSMPTRRGRRRHAGLLHEMLEAAGVGGGR